MSDSSGGVAGTPRLSDWRNTAWQMAARLISIGLQAAAFGLVARILGAESFGSFAVAFALASLVGAAAEFGIQNTTVVELARAPGEATQIYRHAMLASTATVGIGLLAAAPFALILLEQAASVAFFALAPWAILSRLSTPGIAWWQSRMAFPRIFWAEFGGRSVPVVGLALILGSGELSTTTRLVSAGAVLAAGAAVHVLAVRPALPPTKHSARWEFAAAWQLLKLAAPLGLVSAISLVHVRVDQVLLDILGFGGARLGEYAVAYRIVEGAAGVLGGIAIVGFTMVARSSAADRSRISRASTRMTALLGLTGALAVVGFAAPAVHLVGGPGFGGAVEWTRALSIVVVISTLNMVPSLTIVAERQSRRLLPIGVGLVMANVCLNLLLIPHYGVRGAALATITTEILGLLLVTWIASKAVPGSQSFRESVGIVAVAGAVISAALAGGVLVGGALASVVAGVVLLARRLARVRASVRAEGDS